MAECEAPQSGGTAASPLRQIAKEISLGRHGCRSDMETAEMILAIPEMAEALRCRNAALASQMPDLPMERVGELIKGIKPPAP